ncbi:MAG: YtxH domain-containing protein [Anaerolineae bacterium]
MGKGFVAGAIVGGLIGVGAAILYAPRSGKDTQALLKDRAEAIKARVEAFDVEEAKARAQEQALELMEKGRALAEEKRPQLERAVAEAVSAMESLQAGQGLEGLRRRSAEQRARAQQRAAELVDKGLAFLEAKTAQLKEAWQS